MAARFSMRVVLFLWFVWFALFIVIVDAGAGEKRISNSLGMEFVLIKSGMYIMGSPLDEVYRNVNEVEHQVVITQPFYIQSTEVTVAQWRRVMGKRLFARKRGADDMPVVKVSWHDCNKFIKKLNKMSKVTYRLPTEAEWEYACRAGTRTPYSWGYEIDCTRALYAANTRKTDACIPENRKRGLSPDRPAPVRKFPPNPWGLFDMNGNVWEWCADRFDTYSTTISIDPCQTEQGEMRVRRGGSWSSKGHALRSANRAYGHPSSRLQNTGFRLVFNKEN